MIIVDPDLWAKEEHERIQAGVNTRIAEMYPVEADLKYLNKLIDQQVKIKRHPSVLIIPPKISTLVFDLFYKPNTWQSRMQKGKLSLKDLMAWERETEAYKWEKIKFNHSGIMERGAKIMATSYKVSGAFNIPVSKIGRT